MVKVIAGLLRKDDQEISSTIRSIEQVFKLVDQGEGFYQDGFYIDHTNVAYTGAYGDVLIDGLSQLLPVIQKTKSPIDKDKMQTMYHWIDKSCKLRGARGRSRSAKRDSPDSGYV